jgi:uncharacterized protein
MPTLFERVNADIKDAMRSKDELRLGTLRMLAAAIHNREIERHGKGATLTEEDVMDVLTKEAKKRKEAVTLFVQGGREDLAAKERAELEVLQVYLPAAATEDEIRKAVADAIAEVKPQTEKDFGKVMGAAMKPLKGRADTDAVTRCIKEALAS